MRLRKRLDGDTADVSGLRALKDCGFGEGKSFVKLSGLTTIWSSVPKCKQKYCLLAINASKTGVGLRLGVLRLEVGDSKFEEVSPSNS